MTNNNEQLSFLNEQAEADNTPVVCLGMTFENEEARRKYFREELRKKLPELKHIEGFPIGEDEDIIALSDPPYYTACPNPWINDFIEEWEKEKVTKYGRNLNEEYHREPFTTDVSEGKKDPIYSAHSYHTKVPYKAIMRYLLHYTQVGDVILDGFSGTGMTALASQLCGNEEIVRELGVNVLNEKEILLDTGKISSIGKRNCIINDLSPIATLISNFYTSSTNVNLFRKIAQSILSELSSETAWMYKTIHQDSQGNHKYGEVNFIVWSEVFVCPSCNSEVVFWENAVDVENAKVNKEFTCNTCNADLTKKSMERAKESRFDEFTNQVITTTKRVPVLVNYTFNGKVYEKAPDYYDYEIINKINDTKIDTWYPTSLFLQKGEQWGDTWRAGYHFGISHAHHFYTKKNLLILSKYIDKVKKYNCDDAIKKQLIMIMTGGMLGLTLLQRYRPKATFPNMILSGTLYISSLMREWNVPNWLEGKLRGLIRAKNINVGKSRQLISTQSMTNLLIKENSIDYIFTDPPFGGNLMYSELNFLWESWLKILTNNEKEAIVSKSSNKNNIIYQSLMTECFKVYFKVLKPGRWITVEFSNSQASVWNAIQEAMQKAGFVIANVAALDKKQGSFKAITSTTAVKQDLVISAYKPNEEYVNKMRELTNTPESAWTFVNQHLEKLPIFLGLKGEASIVSERTPRILFDRMVAYHVQHGLPVPISSAEFQSGVAQRFPMRDGMAFLESQVAEYDKKRTLVKEFSQMSLFVSDENSAIEWIRQQLMKKPQTRQDLHPQFMKEIQHIAKHEQLPELDDLLIQNFLRYEGEEVVPDQIAAYLRRNYHEYRGLEIDDNKLKEKAMNRWYVPDPNKQADLDKLREKSLLREFDSYVEDLSTHKKKLKQFRTEAIRAGFKKAWGEKNYEKIITVGDRLPEKVIQEDDKLLMYYDNAQVRLEM